MIAVVTRQLVHCACNDAAAQNVRSMHADAAAAPVLRYSSDARLHGT
jgi:hypothetical protein